MSQQGKYANGSRSNIQYLTCAVCGKLTVNTGSICTRCLNISSRPPDPRLSNKDK